MGRKKKDLCDNNLRLSLNNSHFLPDSEVQLLELNGVKEHNKQTEIMNGDFKNICRFWKNSDLNSQSLTNFLIIS